MNMGGFTGIQISDEEVLAMAKGAKQGDVIVRVVVGVIFLIVGVPFGYIWWLLGLSFVPLFVVFGLVGLLFWFLSR